MPIHSALSYFHIVIYDKRKGFKKKCNIIHSQSIVSKELPTLWPWSQMSCPMVSTYDSISLIIKNFASPIEKRSQFFLTIWDHDKHSTKVFNMFIKFQCIFQNRVSVPSSNIIQEERIISSRLSRNYVNITTNNKSLKISFWALYFGFCFIWVYVVSNIQF